MSRADWRALTGWVFGPGSSRRSLTGWVIGMTVPLEVRRLYRRVRQTLRRPRKPWWLARETSSWALSHPAAAQPRNFRSTAQRMRWETLSGAQLAASVDALQRHSAQAGLETSLPFLDWDLVTFILALAPEHWPAPGWHARLHREPLRDTLPPSIYRRRSKVEFTSAAVNRTRESLPAISALCLENRWDSESFVAHASARELVAAFTRTPKPGFASAYSVWAVASLEAWLRRILDYRISPSQESFDAAYRTT